MNDPTTTQEQLIDVREVARRCGVSADSVRRLCDRGHTPEPVRLGRAIRWREAEVNGWIAAGCPRDWRGEVRS